MKQKHVDSLQLELFITILKVVPLNRDVQETILWKIIDHMVTKVRGKGSYTRGRGRSSPGSSGSSYGSSSSSSPIIQRGGMSLVNLKTSQNEASSIHLEDIPENNPLYAQLQAYLSQKQSDTFASIAKEDVDDIKSYEKISKREMIFLLKILIFSEKKNPRRYSSDIW
ncbi:hypothetical protein H5410_046049 [Solanum commersonii]|uniref:Uncharacterized protein n=1 Tax=Solanum commersonii TaxID=4109 RepID=A0A9J5XDD8_SOLCO|nr:hypothetical protein H5410_046049 [Solanum commersonii]